MRLSGTLNSWNDDRGFGFIAQSDGGADIFVHVSEFSPGGNRPAVGEKLTYELGHGSNGRPQAVKVVRLDGGADRSSRTENAGNVKTRFSMVETCAFAIIVAIGGTWGYQHFFAPQEHQVVAEAPALPSAPAATTSVVAPATVVPVEVAPAATTPPEVAPVVVAPAVVAPLPLHLQYLHLWQLRPNLLPLCFAVMEEPIVRK